MKKYKNSVLKLVIAFIVMFSTLKAASQCTFYFTNIGQNTTTVTLPPNGGSVTIYFTSSGCALTLVPFFQNTDPGWISSFQMNQSGGIYTSITINATANHTGAAKTMNAAFHMYDFNAGSSSPIGTINLSQADSGNRIWYQDTDGDGTRDPLGSSQIASSSPGSNWTLNETIDNCPNDVGLLSNNGCPSGYVYENRNWITSKTFNIAGTTKSSSKAYFDDLGKPTQSQSKDLKTGKVWASQTLYDEQGRPALSTLSAPVKYGNFEYKSDFIKDENGNTYNNADFENDPLNPSKVSATANTLGAYYSNSNTTIVNPFFTSDPRKEGNSYQDITEYPFSRTIYSELNPGAALRTIGGNKTDTDEDGDVDDNDTWLQGYTFSMPAGNELTQLGAFADASYQVSNTRKIIKTVTKDVHGREAVIFTDTDGKTLAAARVGATSYNHTIITIGAQGFVDVHVPIDTEGFSISNVPAGITTEVYDLITEEKVTGSTSSLEPGFYRVAVTNLAIYDASNPITITCKENYYDYSLNEYDEVGRLIASYQPIGRTKATKLVSTFEYDALGQLTQTHSPDEGDAWFLYRRDGQIRFSINSKQWGNKEFSYTNYDKLGRPVESGVYNDAASTYLTSIPSTINKDTDPFKTALKNLIDIESGDGLNDTNCSEVQTTTYDDLSNSDITTLSNLSGNYDNPSFLAGNVAKTYNDNTTTYYSYDVYGRVKWIVQKITGLGTGNQNYKTIDYKYDPITGAVLEVDYQKNVASERFVHQYNYLNFFHDDELLSSVQTSTDGTNFTTHATYEYYETKALKRIEIAPQGNVPLQAIDYVYNLNGQLKAINPTGTSQSGDLEDLFSMQIDYHNHDYSRGERNDIGTFAYGKDQFNGNIKGIRWNNKKLEDDEKTYSYYYNKNNWLTDAVYGQYDDTGGDGIKINIFDDKSYENVNKAFNASNSITWSPGFHAKPGTNQQVTAKIVTGSLSTFQSGQYNVFDITYDANGNIKTLNRNKNGATNNKMDYLNYTYKADKPNQLLRVDDAAGEVLAGKDIGDQDGENYVYNSIGQLVRNNAENIEYIYNASGLVTEVKHNNQPRVKFFYNDKGYRVKKESYKSDGSGLDFTEHYVRDAAGTALAIYRNGTPKEHTIYGAGRLGVFNRNSSGTGGNSVYQLTDHLGNVRTVAQWSGSSAVAIVATDYYPFGMPMPNRDDGAGVNGYRYKYQGQEVDPETGKEAFELRLWDSRIGRWLTTDPAGQYSSPYLGVGNNPIRKVDPDGGKANDWFYDKDGNLQFDERVHSQADVDRLYGGGVLDAFSGGVYKSEYFHEGDYFYHSNGLVSNFKTGDVWQFNKIQVLDEIIIGASGRSNIEGYDFSLAVETLNSNCKNSSTGRCAKYVRFALEGGGLDLSNRPASTASAKGYKDYLPTLGFKGVSNDSYVPMAGDIVVIQSFTGNKVHKHGHIQMYNGSHWVSDFKQTGFWPGSDYRNNTPAYSIFR